MSSEEDEEVDDVHELDMEDGYVDSDEDTHSVASVSIEDRSEWSVPDIQSYMFDGCDVREVANTPLPDDVIELGLLHFDVVALIGEQIPLQFSDPESMSLIREAVDSGGHIAVAFHVHREVKRDAVVVQILRYSDSMLPVCIKAHGVVKHKCRIVSKLDARSNKASVVLVAHECLAPFGSSFLPRRFLAFPPQQRVSLAEKMSGCPRLAIDECSSVCQSHRLLERTKGWLPEEKAKQLIDAGVGIFANWVSRSLPLDVGQKAELIPFDGIDVLLKFLNHVNIDELFALCTMCSTVLFEPKHVMYLQGFGTSGIFVNNGDYMHDMVLMGEVSGVSVRGPPYSDFSWFPGYAWRMAVCSRCQSHVGWQFVSRHVRPPSFYGITRTAFQLISTNHIAPMLSMGQHQE